MTKPRADKTVELKVTIEISGEETREITIGYPINLLEVPHASTIVASRVRNYLELALTTTRIGV